MWLFVQLVKPVCTGVCANGSPILESTHTKWQAIIKQSCLHYYCVDVMDSANLQICHELYLQPNKNNSIYIFFTFVCLYPHNLRLARQGCNILSERWNINDLFNILTTSVKTFTL